MDSGHIIIIIFEVDSAYACIHAFVRACVCSCMCVCVCVCACVCACMYMYERMHILQDVQAHTYSIRNLCYARIIRVFIGIRAHDY